MSFSPVPDFKFGALTDISPDFLQRHEIRLLMLDLDNTIAPYDEQRPSEELLRWIDGIKNAGIELWIVSNSKKQERVSVFSEALGIPYINKAKKPSSRAVRQTMRRMEVTEKNSALAGDQIYTDVLAANGAGAKSILVHPIKFTNPFLAIRYALELPFRALRRRQKIK